jgi:hypothetical protein
MIRSRRFQGEDGQILVIVMAFMMLFAILIPAILGLASTNLKATTKIHDQRDAAWAVDGAMDGAIQYVRGDVDFGNGDFCPTFRVTLNGVEAEVTCVSVRDDVLELDRHIQFDATAGDAALTATVFFRDSSAGGGEPDVDVESWRYER